METLVQSALEAHETIGQFLKDYWIVLVWFGAVYYVSNYLAGLVSIQTKKHD